MYFKRCADIAAILVTGMATSHDNKNQETRAVCPSSTVDPTKGSKPWSTDDITDILVGKNTIAEQEPGRYAPGLIVDPALGSKPWSTNVVILNYL